MKCQTNVITDSMKGSEMMQNYVVAEEVAEELGVSRGKAYAIIRQLNEELSEKGYLTLAGKVSRKYFEERIYGYEGGEKNGCA